MGIAFIGLFIILSIIIFKYKPVYKVSVANQELGYIKDDKTLEETIKEYILSEEKLNIDNIDINIDTKCDRVLVSKTENINKSNIIDTIMKDIKITYKYYEITIQDEKIETVNTMEEAQTLITEIKKGDNKIDSLSILEKFTQNKEDVVVSSVEVAKVDIQNRANALAKKKEAEKLEQERYNALPDINGIKLAATPLKGVITSRFGEVSRIRSSAHKGLDIAATTGTPIKAVSDGTVSFAGYSGAYGYLVKIKHGEGFESWYAHASKIYVSKDEYVKAGDIVSAVGSTGNSTGPHLHLELRINGAPVNPQGYIYK